MVKVHPQKIQDVALVGNPKTAAGGVEQQGADGRTGVEQPVFGTARTPGPTARAAATPVKLGELRSANLMCHRRIIDSKAVFATCDLATIRFMKNVRVARRPVRRRRCPIKVPQSLLKGKLVRTRARA